MEMKYKIRFKKTGFLKKTSEEKNKEEMINDLKQFNEKFKNTFKSKWLEILKKLGSKFNPAYEVIGDIDIISSWELEPNDDDTYTLTIVLNDAWIMFLRENWKYLDWFAKKVMRRDVAFVDYVLKRKIRQAIEDYADVIEVIE